MRNLLLSVLAVGSLAFADSARAQDTSAGFTVWDNIAKVSWPKGLKKRALIIGNGTYDPNGDGDSKPPPRPMKNLLNPCGDARFIAKSLVTAGWVADEVSVACDQESSSMATALQALYDSLPPNPVEDQLTFVYFAGHGMQIGANDYFFGKNALPDFTEAASRLQYSPGVRVFTQQTIDPIGFFTNAFGGNRTRRPILLVIDACRDDPLFENIRQALLSKAKTLDPSSQEQINQTARSITAPAGGGIDFPTGLKVVFGSTVGHVVQDDNGVDGHSRLSSALGTEIGAGGSKTALAVVSKTLDDVEDAVQGMTDARFRRAQGLGDLEGDPCLSRCGLTSARRPTGRQMAAPSLFQLAALRSQQPADVADPDSPQQPSASAAHAADPASGVAAGRPGFEVFWCSTGTAADAARRQSAERAAELVLADSTDPVLMGLDVRISELKEADNSKPGFQINDDSLLFDPRNAAIGEAIHMGLPGLQSIPERSNAVGYISAYYCKGAYDGPVSATVYIQVPDSSMLNYSSVVIDRLKRKFPSLYIKPQTEVRDNSPNQTELRFFDRRKTRDIRRVAATLSSVIGVKVRRRLFSSMTSVKSINQYEIWIGKKDSEAVEAHLLSASSTAF